MEPIGVAALALQIDDLSLYDGEKSEDEFGVEYFDTRQEKELVENRWGLGCQWQTFEAPDSIQFRKYQPLMEKMTELRSGIVFLEHAYMFGRKELVEVPAIHAKTFFTALKAIQTSDPKLFVPTTLLEKTLEGLRSKKYLTKNDAHKIRWSIRSHMTERQYADAAFGGDASKALSLAIYRRKTNNWNDALDWLALAKRRASQTAFSCSIDLVDFLQPFPGLSSLSIFTKGCEEIVDAAIRSQHITTLSISLFLPSSDIVQNISRFLENSSSIKTICIYDSFLDEADALQLMQAIGRNKQAQITRLQFDERRLSDASAQKFLELLTSKETIIDASISEKASISAPLREKIEKLIQERKPSSHGRK